jgi:two-component system sensor histidine kinase HydH
MGNPLEHLFFFGGGSLLSLILVALYLLLLALYRNNAELKEREVRNRELAELGEAARTLVHEIKNPLGIIGIQSGLLRRREGEDSPTGQAALVIDGEVRRLARMADRIREFLKAGPGEATVIALGEFLATFAARYPNEGGDAGSVGPRIILTIAAQAGHARVRVDPDRLSLAIDNLVRNAWEADPRGHVELGLEVRGRALEISLKDQGPGVPAAARERLFEPFFTTKERGSGIGLALARSIARGAGGDLVWRDRPGGGALFVLSLPSLDRP